MRLYLISILLIMFVSCRKDISLDVPDPESMYVVEGYIEQGKFPIVYLSRSMSFFSEIDSADLFNAMTYQAKMTISNGDTSEIMILRRNDNHYPIYYYTGNEIRGEVGKTYMLTVEIYGTIITATTSIPLPPQLDSMWCVYEEDTTGFNYDSGYLMIRYTDDASTKDYFRTLMKVNGQDMDYVPTYIQSFDDQYFSGESVSFPLYRGFSSIQDLKELNKYFKKGDTVVLKTCRIDKACFDFWRSYEGKILNLSSFSPTTNKMLTNVNGGLGVWGGYGATYDTIIAQ